MPDTLLGPLDATQPGKGEPYPLSTSILSLPFHPALTLSGLRYYVHCKGILSGLSFPFLPSPPPFTPCTVTPGTYYILLITSPLQKTGSVLSYLILLPPSEGSDTLAGLFFHQYTRQESALLEVGHSQVDTSVAQHREPPPQLTCCPPGGSSLCTLPL